VHVSLLRLILVSWGNVGAALQVNVECRNAAGDFLDTRYDVLVIE